MALPWLIGGAVLATVAYLASDDDDSSSSSDRDEREREARERAKEEKNEQIREEIREYKDKQSLEIEKKYEAIVNFDVQEDLKVLMAQLEGKTKHEDINKATKVQILYQDKTLQYEIDALKKETIELEEAIKELEAIKNETLR